jgi:hypothetical protein
LLKKESRSLIELVLEAAGKQKRLFKILRKRKWRLHFYCTPSTTTDQTQGKSKQAADDREVFHWIVKSDMLFHKKQEAARVVICAPPAWQSNLHFYLYFLKNYEAMLVVHGCDHFPACFCASHTPSSLDLPIVPSRLGL